MTVWLRRVNSGFYEEYGSLLSIWVSVVVAMVAWLGRIASDG